MRELNYYKNTILFLFVIVVLIGMLENSTIRTLRTNNLDLKDSVSYYKQKCSVDTMIFNCRFCKSTNIVKLKWK